jgi:ribosomal protein L21E
MSAKGDAVKNLKLLLVAGVVLGIAGIVWCQESRPRPNGIFGTIVKVDGKNVIVKTGRGDQAKEVTVATDDKTEFVVDAEAGKLEDLKAEMRVFITPATGTATKVTATSKGLTGTIVKVDGKNVVVKTGRGEDAKEVTVVTDEKTKVFVDDKPAKLDDLKADMRVTVLPETGTATKILANAARRPRG